MASWDIVNTDWDPEEETANFGTRHCVIAGNSIFDVTTVATIGSSEVPNKVFPSVRGQCVANEASVAVDAYVHVFEVTNNALKASLQLPATVECLTWLPGKNILAIASHDGTVSIFNSASRTMLINKKVAASDSFGVTFAGLSFQKELDSYCLYCFLTNGTIIKISGLNANALSEGSDNVNIAAFLCSVKITSWNITEQDIRFSYVNMCQRGIKLQAVLGANENILLYDLSLQALIKIFPWECDIKFVERTSNQKIIFALDDQGRILKLCAQTFLLLCVWDHVPIKQLVLLDYGTQEEPRLLTLTSTDEEGDCLIEVRQMRDFSVMFSLKLWRFSYVLPFQGDVDHIMLLEGALDLQSNVTSLRLRSFQAAQPETRLSRLIARRDFSKAESFAQTFGLPLENVYKAKACWLLENLSPWLPGARHKTDTDVRAWLDVLDLVQDMQFICGCCWKAALPTLQDAQVALLYARKRLDSSQGSFDEHETWKAVLNIALQRLTTFRLLYSKQPNTVAVEAWYSLSPSFETIEWMSEYLERGEVAQALLIWDRHESECLSHLSADLDELISCVGNLPVPILLSFFGRVLPPILRALPESRSVVVEWTINKTKSLEASESKTWPLTGFRFASAVLECLKVNGKLDLRYGSQNVVGVEGNLDELDNLVECLQEMTTLWQEYGIRVDLETYSQENKTEAVLELLSWINASEDMETFLKGFLLNYIAKYCLDASHVLLMYIKGVIEDSKEGWWAGEEAPWEDMVCLLVKFMTNLREIGAAVTLAAESAPVPWSPTIWNLVNLHIATLPHVDAEALKEIASLIPLKTVLRNYNVRHFNLSDIEDMKRIVRFIFLAGRAERLTHALEVSKACPEIMESFVYEAYFHQAAEEGNTDECLNALAETSITTRKVCCRVLILHAIELHDVMCKTPKLAHVVEKSANVYAEAVSRLVSLIDDVTSRERESMAVMAENLKSVRKLKERFSVCLTINDFGKRERCLSALQQICSTKLQTCGPDDVYVLFDSVQEAALLLRIPTGKAVCHLCLIAADKGKENLLPSLLPLLFDTYTSAQQDLSFLLETVQKLTLQEKLGEQHELAPQLHLLAALAASYVPKELLPSCVELLQWLRLSAQLTPTEVDRPFPGMTCQALCDVYSGFAVGLHQPEIMGQLRTCLGHSFSAIDTGSPPLLWKPFLESVFALIDSLEEGQHLDLALNLLSRLQALMELWRQYLPKEKATELKAYFEERRQKVAKHLFLRIVGGSRIDTTAALTCLLFMSGGALNELRTMAERYNSDYRRLGWVCKLAIELSKVRPVDPEITRSFRVLLSQSVLVRRLARLGISVQGFDLTRLLVQRGRVRSVSEGGDLTRAVAELGKLKGKESKLVASLALSFGAEEKDFLQIYLKSKVLSITYGPKTTASDLEPQFQEIKHVLAQLEGVVRLALLDSLLSEVNPYYYEVLGFLLDTIMDIKQCLNKENLAFVQRSRELLNFLMSYTRRKSPKFAIENVEKLMEIDHMDIETLCKTRLPFPLIVQDFKPVLEAEMDLNTWKLWYAAAPLIGMSPDDVCVVAASNSIDELIDKMKLAVKEGWTNPVTWHPASPNHTFLTALQECVFTIENKKLAVICLHQVFDKLPNGEDKVLAGRYCMQLAEAWVASGDAAAHDVLNKVRNRYWLLATQGILHKFHLATTDYLPLCSSPEKLTKALYEDPSIALSATNRDINSAVEEICIVHGINVFKLRSTYLTDWLAPVGLNAADSDDTLTARPNLAPKLQEDSEKQNEINLKRAIYVFRGCVYPNPSQTHVDYVAAIGFGDDASCGPLYRLRALLCLQAVIPEDELETKYGVSIEKLKEYCGCLNLLSDLESVGLAMSVNSFRKCDYAALAKRLVGTNTGDKKRLRVAARVCQYADLWNPVLWCELLLGMVKVKMIDEAQELLDKFVANDSSAMLPAWNAVLQAPFKYVSIKASQEEVKAAVKSLHLVWKSTAPADFDLVELRRLIESSAVPFLAALLIPFIECPSMLRNELLERFTVQGLVDKLKACEMPDFPFSLHLQGLLHSTV